MSRNLPILFLLVGLLSLANGCGKYVVRNANVYVSEVAWTSAAMAQSAALHRETATERLAAGDVDGCVKAAELALVLEVRAPWHAAMALHLAELGEEPGDLPDIPDPATLCLEDSR